MDEGTTRMRLEKDSSTLKLAVVNQSGKALSAHVRVEVLDPQDKVLSVAQAESRLLPGAGVVSLTISLAARTEKEQDEALWYRLRYRVEPADLAPVVGVVAVAEVTPEIFELRVAAPEYVTPGSLYPVRVRAQHPATQRPVSGVAVSAQVELGDGHKPLQAEGITGSNGYALLEFHLPQFISGNEPRLAVFGRLGSFSRREENKIYLGNWPQLFITTDKPLYQPGQVLHLRALLLDPAGRTAPAETLKLTIEDPDDTLVHQASLQTSRFGVAQADWYIPESLKLGSYRVKLETQGEHFPEESGGRAYVRISRYELPDFTVNVKPDRAYYLPGQSAAVEVSAEYLFGKPVTRGHVRVARVEERTWNFQEQRWDVKEEEPHEGDTDAQGVFLAHVDLSESQDDLKESSYRRFRDVRYAAYFTDPSTGRTEQRRFLLRVTQDPIHVYLIDDWYRNARSLPLEFYVSAFYADGAPCECAVSIREGENEDDAGPVLRTVRTNKYGVAKISGLELPPNRERHTGNYTYVLLQARDEAGATGEHSDEVGRGNNNILRIATDKTLYRPGEPVKVGIRASDRNLLLVFDVWSETKLASSQLARVRGGKAFVMVPYRESFRGAVELRAYAMTGPETYRYGGSHVVLYPHDTTLGVGVRLSQGTYKPGEQAVADLKVDAPGGTPAQAALGVVVFDKAVEERYRTDHEFGDRGGYGFADAFGDLWGYTTRMGSISRADLNKLDVSQPFSEDLDLVAEVLLSQEGSAYTNVFGGGEFPSGARSVFQKRLDAQLGPVRTALDEVYGSTMQYPKDKAGARALLAKKGVHVDDLLDPWGVVYGVNFHSERDMDVMELSSAGPDKRPDTDDDFTALTIERPYFRPTGLIIDRALQEYHARTGGFARDAATLSQDLSRLGLEFGTLRDLWGQPYRLEFGVNNARFYVSVRSSGPDKMFDTKQYGDDFTLWTSYTEYFADTQAAIDAALATHFLGTGKFPLSEADLLELLRQSGIAEDKLRDGWGRSLYMTFNNESRYADRLAMSYTDYIRGAKRGTSLIPVTQQVAYIHLRSAGQDGKVNTADDFEVATFCRIWAEQTAMQAQAQATPKRAPLSGTLGGIEGTVRDQQGAMISGATIKVSDPLTRFVSEATTDDTGGYELRNLPASDYIVTAQARGFLPAVVKSVPVQAGQMTVMDFVLAVSARTEVVEVVGTSPTVESTTSMLAASKTVVGTQPISTPRLRQFFPETLLWQPEVITDAGGRTRMKFKLADNITTWKMSVVASTLDGRIGVADKEFRAFQPFFVELDPPQVLTQGDEIALPVVLRNYLDKSQTLNVSMKPESWFTLLSPAEQRAEVAAGDSATTSFRFGTVSSIQDGKQRVTAANRATGDSVEKSVRVHPDGEEVAYTSTQLFEGRKTLDLTIPDYAIAGTTRAELKIYPNLMDHVLESVEAILQRPYGCGEQTISSTYPNVMLLRLYKRMGKAPDEVYARSQRYAQMGYQRLLSYRDESGGGFTYWGRGDPDLALTAYALRFLQDAAEFVPVDEDVVEDARTWLVQQQKPDGTWGISDSTTAYVARTLAATPVAAPKGAEDEREAAERKKAAEMRLAALDRAISYLSRRVTGTPDAYMLASFALAASQAGKNEEAARARTRLAGFRHEENGAAYWALETNTPFYGWGRTGRIETTALAVQALVQAGDRKVADPGLLFLLRNQDRYGTWYSTQATVNVLDALMLLQEGAPPGASGSTADILVNGRKASTVILPGEGELRNPVSVNLSAFVQPGANHVEVVRSGAPQAATAQLVAAYYIPWGKSAAGAGAKTRTGDSDALSLRVAYDKTEAKAGEAVQCRVHAERIGHRGYGMLLAEIGLPPAAEVDRASLEAAVNNAGWAVRRYEVLPDRLIVYLWPQAGGIEFEFSFRPRYGMNALTAASFIYDYYNPEASAVIAPTRFVIH